MIGTCHNNGLYGCVPLYSACGIHVCLGGRDPTQKKKN